MLSFLINAFKTPTIPSAVLVVGRFGYIDILHLVPEDSTIEHISTLSTSPTFRYDGSREQAREQIGTVTIHSGDGEATDEFFDDVETRIREPQTGSLEVTQLVQEILQPAVSDAIHKREGRNRSLNAMETYPVFVVYIKRPRAGQIVGEPRSINY